MIPITYIHPFVDEPDLAFKALWDELAWVRHDKVPRREYYTSRSGADYAYGRAPYTRTYASQPGHRMIAAIQAQCEAVAETTFDVCFLNGYENSRDQLGWHADDSPEMDDARPIAIVSLGAERNIMFRPNANTLETATLLLQHGSLCLMRAGMQDTHMHRIPKASFECGPRVSLTFRGYVAP